MMNPTDLVLVAIMPSPRDLEIARVLGWYRIPYKTAPKTVDVEALAFYQTADFGEEKWAINYTAPVVGHELLTRAELLRTEKDHPRADEQYFKIQIGPLERLPRPIPSLKWRRITFFYTTGERLMAAAEINDLIVDSDERQLLWTALKDRGLSAERQYENAPGGTIDFAILCELGKLAVMLGEKKEMRETRELREEGEWKYLAIPESEVSSDLNGVVQKIQNEVRKLGGLAK
jgi:hypothetical protein